MPDDSKLIEAFTDTIAEIFADTAMHGKGVVPRRLAKQLVKTLHARQSDIPYRDLMEPALERIKNTMCETLSLHDGKPVTRIEGRISADDYENFVRLVYLRAPERELTVENCKVIESDI